LSYYVNQNYDLNKEKSNYDLKDDNIFCQLKHVLEYKNDDYAQLSKNYQSYVSYTS